MIWFICFAYWLNITSGSCCWLVATADRMVIISEWQKHVSKEYRVNYSVDTIYMFKLFLSLLLLLLFSHVSAIGMLVTFVSALDASIYIISSGFVDVNLSFLSSYNIIG